MALQQKAFSDIITFSRSSNATRTGPDGTVQYAPHNLLTYSEDLSNVIWAKTQASATVNAIAAPNGTVTADLLVENTASAQHEVRYSYTFTAATVYTLSVYAKASGRNLLVYLDGYSGGANFDLSAGTVGANVGTAPSSAFITAVGNGWYRCSITVTWGTGSTSNIRLMTLSGTTNSYTGDGASGVYLWGAQLSVGSIAGDYTPTTSAAVYGPRFDYDGSGVTNVQPIATNLLTYSEQFDNAAWTKVRMSITANAIAAPNGTVTADAFVEDTTASNTHVLYVARSGLTSGSTYSFSLYVKANGRTQVSISCGSAAFTGIGGTLFDLSANTASNGTGVVGSSITDVGNGWKRIVYTVTANGTGSGDIYIGTYVNGSGTYTGDGTSGVYVWGAQLEAGGTATDYMASGATNGMRAVPVTTGSVVARGLLIEEQRTNLLTYSEDFSNAVWGTASNVTITTNTAAAPNGTITADTMTEVATTATHRVEYITSGTSVATQYTVSCYVKPASGSPWFRLTFTDSTGNHQAQCWFDLTNGVNGSTAVVGSAVLASRSITAVGNGWYRCTLTATVTGGTGVVYLYISLANADGVQSYLGSTSRAVYLWGAQVEAGAFATSYIPTIASSVTRSADVATVNTLSPWFNATEGTLFTEFDVVGKLPSTSQAVAALTDASASNYALLYKNSSNNFALEVISGGVSQANPVLSSAAVNTTYKLAGAYKTNDFAAVQNGGTVTTDTLGSVPSSVSYLGLGYLVAGAPLQLNGHLRRIAYYPRRLTNAELQAITA